MAESCLANRRAAAVTRAAEIPAPRARHAVAARGHHLSGPRLHSRCRPAHAGRSADQPRGLGLGHERILLYYGAFEIPTGALGDRIGPRRVLTRIVAWWSAFTALTGIGVELLRPVAGAILFRRRRGRRLSECVGGDRTLDPGCQAHARLGSRVDEQLRSAPPCRRCSSSRSRCAMAGGRPSSCSVSLGVVWSVAWYVWFRDSPHEKAGVSEAELREIGSAPGRRHHGMPWATALRIPALWRIAAIGACYVYALGFFQGWLQTYLVKGRGFSEAALVLSSLTYAVGATANGLGGLAGDWMVRRYGLRNGRRWLGARDSGRRRCS